MLIRSRVWVGVCALSLVTAGAVAACGGSDSGTGIGTDDSGAGTDAATTADGSPDGAGISDAAADGQTLAEGGSNLDPDAGDDGDDAGPDGGKCNMIVNSASAIQSTCLAVVPTLSGGALVAGKYHLVGAAALAAATFCTATFKPASIQETLDVVAAGGAFAAESITEAAPAAPRRRTLTLTPGAGDTSPMQIADVCPADKAAGPAGYASMVVGGKQQLLLRLAYGKGEAIYTFEKQ